jgi:hypothetical protein
MEKIVKQWACVALKASGKMWVDWGWTQGSLEKRRGAQKANVYDQQRAPSPNTHEKLARISKKKANAPMVKSS